MRVSTQQLSQTMQYHMSSTMASMNKIVTQLSSGKAIQKPSDDPLASLQVMALKDQSAEIEAYGKNITSAKNALDMSETLLGNMNNTLTRTRELVLAIGGKPMSSDGKANPDIAASVKEIEGLVKELADTTNSKHATGESVFAGTAGDKPAVVFDEATGQYQIGSKGEVREIQVSDSQSIPMGVLASDVLGTGDSNILNQLTDFNKLATDPNTTQADMEAAIADTLEALDNCHSQVNQSLTEIGSSLNNLQMAEDCNEDMKTFNQTLQNSLENVNVSQATMDFAQQKQQMEDCQKAYAMVNRTSLFDYL